MATLMSFIGLLVVLTIVSQVQVHGQFFTKTSKSVPRLGRRGDTSFNSLRMALVHEITPMGRFFRKYDVNSDWCLSPEEMWESPLFKVSNSARDTAASASAPSPESSDSMVTDDVDERSSDAAVNQADPLRGLLSSFSKK